jgi:hypothetical protein
VTVTVRADPALCHPHPRLRHMYGAVHECLECGLRGELVGWKSDTKRCPRCGETKPRDAFSGAYCRPCRRSYRLARLEAR